MSAAKQHNCLHQRSSPVIFSIQETFSDIPIQVTPCILPSPLNTSPVRPPAGRGLWTEQELKGQARYQREQLLSDSTVVGRDMSQKSCLKFHNTWPWAPGTLCDVGNEISSYTKRTRVTGLPITWHYTYRFLLTGFGIFSPLFPIHHFSTAGSTSQHLLHSPLNQQESGASPLPHTWLLTCLSTRRQCFSPYPCLSPCPCPLPCKSPQWQHLPNLCQTMARGLIFGFWQGGSVPKQLLPSSWKKRVTGQKTFATLFLIYYQIDHTHQDTAVSRLC